MRWISPRDLEGLQLIKVIDESYDDPESAKVPLYLKGFPSRGMYLRQTATRGAQVVLYGTYLYLGIPKFFMRNSMVTLNLTRVLAHELGHHVIATRGYIYQPGEKYKPWDGIRNPYEEKMADAYAADVMGRMLRQWRYKLGRLLARMLSMFLYKAGIQDYWDGNYQTAASREFLSYNFNPENEAAGQCYRHAMEKLKTQTPSPLTASEREWLLHKYDGNPIRTATLQRRKEIEEYAMLKKNRRRSRKKKGGTLRINS